MKNINKKILKTLIENEVSNFINMLLEQATPAEVQEPAPESVPNQSASETAPSASVPISNASIADAEITPAVVDPNTPETPPSDTATTPDTETTVPSTNASPDLSDVSSSPDAAAQTPDLSGGNIQMKPGEAISETMPEEENFGIKSIETSENASPEETKKIQFNNKLLELVKTKREEYKDLINPDQLIWNELKTELINSKKGLEEVIPTLTALSVSTDQIISSVAHNLAVFILLK